MKKIMIKVLLGIVSITLVACQSFIGGKPKEAVDVNTEETFVQVQGNRFYKNGKPYFYVGTNFWYGAYLGASDEGRLRLTAELDQLKALGVNNLRILAASEKTDLIMAVNPAIQLAPNEFNEDLLKGLDVVLAELAKRDMHAVLYLNNFWQWSGGMAQYMSWITGEPAFDPDETGDWNGFMQNSAKFYRNPKAQSWYRGMIKAVVGRTNTINGTAYIDDKTIMSWQLANEPRPGSDEGSRPFYEHYKTWIQQTAQYIKSLDANHLVSTGSEGAMGSARDIDLYKEVHNIPEVDYLTFHLWPKNWSWFDINNVDATYKEATLTSKAYILQHIEIANALNKPTVLEEFGIERDNADYGMASTTKVRDKFYAELFGFIELQAKLGTAMSGSNFWAWGGAGRAMHKNFVWAAGDPFTGDPPQEAQGLNSVFDTDESTLKVIADHAGVMNSL